jgi:hypothetical protein
MKARWTKLLAASASVVMLAIACTPPASARLAGNLLSANLLSANRLAANLLSANAVGEKTKFDTRAVTISKVTLPDGTVLTLR